jgi:hypothetical protein
MQPHHRSLMHPSENVSVPQLEIMDIKRGRLEVGKGGIPHIAVLEAVVMCTSGN